MRLDDTALAREGQGHRPLERRVDMHGSALDTTNIDTVVVNSSNQREAERCLHERCGASAPRALLRAWSDRQDNRLIVGDARILRPLRLVALGPLQART